MITPDEDVLTLAIARTKYCAYVGQEKVCPDPEKYHRIDAESIILEYAAILQERAEDPTRGNC